MKPRIFLILLPLILAAACVPRSKSKDELKAAFRQIADSGAQDTIQARAFIRDAGQYIKTHRQDSANVHFIRLIAETQTLLGDAGAAIQSWDRLRSEYPAHPLAAEALFKKAFILSEMQHDLLQSRPLYEEFIIRYPNHHLAEAARFQLQTLERSPEDIIRLLTQQQPDSSTATSAE